MNLNQFLYNLHFDVESVRALDVKVDWEDAPLPFKVYSGAEKLALPSASLPHLSKLKQAANASNLDDLASLLWYSYGVSGLAQNYVPAEDNPFDVNLVQTLRRFVPSGGALYPSELYIYLNTDEDHRGVYHYDAERHSLSLLRKGNFEDYLNQAACARMDFSNVAGVLFISTMFWKNYFKYHDFSYRLQGIDAGALLGQILAAANWLDFASYVQFQFLDAALNHLLGLSENLETVYAMVPLVRKMDGVHLLKKRPQRQLVFASDLCKTLEPVRHSYHIRAKKVGEYPNIAALSRAAMYESTKEYPETDETSSQYERARQSRGYGPTQPEAEQAVTVQSPVSQSRTDKGKETEAQRDRVQLPQVPNLVFDFNKACRKRYSPGTDFRFGTVSVHDLAVLLHESSRVLDSNNDIRLKEKFGKTEDIHAVISSPIVLGVCLHAVPGMDDGAYVYNAVTRRLHLRSAGDQRRRLQAGMSMQNVNLFQTPLCFHILGTSDHLQYVFGWRGHRIQHMEVGVVLQKLLLTASALGMNGHPLLDYDEALCDDIYTSSAIDKTTLIQIPVGYFRPTARLDAPLSF